MEDTFTLTRTELKGFFKCISKKFNIPYKTIALEYNAYLDSLSESENTTACSQSEPTTDVLDNTAAPVEEVVALTCVAVKKDKTVCGKKATVGDRCSIHKPKNSAVEKQAAPVEEVVALTCVAVKKDKTVCGKKATVGDRCSIHKPKNSAVEKQAAPVEEVVALTCVAVKKDKTVCGKKATVGDRCSIHKPKNSAVEKQAAPVEEVVALTCVAVKKDKTVCGKKATVGDRCSIHKPKNSEKEENKPNNPEIWGVLLSPRPEPTKIVYKIEMHPRLGLYWDRTGGTRFVFSKKTGKYVAIAKYTHMTLKLSESDIQLCEKFSLPYVVTDLKDLQPEYPDQITIDGEYDRIKFELENAEFERLAREAENSIVKVPVAEVPVAEVPVAEVPVAEVPVAEVPVAEVPVAEVPVAEVPVVEVPTKKSGRVKNLSIDPKKFPKHRKDVKTMDIVDSLKEIIIEPELEDTIV